MSASRGTGSVRELVAHFEQLNDSGNVPQVPNNTPEMDPARLAVQLGPTQPALPVLTEEQAYGLIIHEAATMNERLTAVQRYNLLVSLDPNSTDPRLASLLEERRRRGLHLGEPRRPIPRLLTSRQVLERGIDNVFVPSAPATPAAPVIASGPFKPIGRWSGRGFDRGFGRDFGWGTERDFGRGSVRPFGRGFATGHGRGFARGSLPATPRTPVVQDRNPARGNRVDVVLARIAAAHRAGTTTAPVQAPAAQAPQTPAPAMVPPPAVVAQLPGPAVMNDQNWPALRPRPARAEGRRASL